MSNRRIKSKKKRKLIVVVAIGLLLCITGIFGIKAYYKHQQNKIYSVDETMRYSELTVTVTKVENKPINLPIQNNLVQQYGGLDNNENCDTFSKTSTLTYLGTPEAVPYGPSDYNLCIRRNESRKAIKDYSSANHQVVINYKITTKKQLSTSKIKIQLSPDSGRDLSSPVYSLACNEFIHPSTYDFAGTRISSKCEPDSYYFQSDLGNNINEGLTRSGYLYTDVKNSEVSADFILTYYGNAKQESRTTRIDLTRE